MNLVLLKAPGIPLKNLVSKYCCKNGNLGITDNSEKTLQKPKRNVATSASSHEI